MDIKLDPPAATKNQIETLLHRRDYLKKVSHERLAQGKEVIVGMKEVNAINSVLKELFALRASQQTISQPDESADSDAPAPDQVEVGTLSTKEVLAMLLPDRKYPVEVKETQRIRFFPTAELRLARTTSEVMDVVNVGLWKLDEKTDEWHNKGGFKIPVEGFYALAKELINLKI